MNKRDKLCDYFFNHFEVPSTFTFRDVFNAGFDAAISEVLKGIAREQDYREYRVDKSGDQDGSAIGACKEIASYVRQLSGGSHEV